MDIPTDIIARFEAAIRTFYESEERRLNAKKIPDSVRDEYMLNIRKVCDNVKTIGENVKDMIAHCRDYEQFLRIAETMEHPRCAVLQERCEEVNKRTLSRVADLMAMIVQMEAGKFPNGIAE